MPIPKIAIVGSSGSGKTTLARQLVETLGVTHIELDALYHQADWQHPSDQEFVELVGEAMDRAPQGWVMCGSYERLVGGLRRERADTIPVGYGQSASRVTVAWPGPT